MTNSKCSLEIVRTLGIGGMATVYLARRDEGGTSRVVAVKKPHAFLTEDPATMAVLADEAELGACIRHPNVVGVIDFVGGNDPALVMEWVDGIELGKLARAAAHGGRRLPVDVVAAIARDVLAGLHAAHESRHADGRALDIVHRDVSPQNVLVGFDGAARITDFGVAKAACRDQHTERDSIKGKLRYLAPEQLGGGCDRRADIYSVGAVLWELLTGERLRSGNGVEMLVEILCAQVQAPSATAPEAAGLDAIVMRALERDPEERFATAADMLAAIEGTTVVASAARVAEVVRALVGTEEPANVEASATVEESETPVSELGIAAVPSFARAIGETVRRLSPAHPRARVRASASERHGANLAMKMSCLPLLVNGPPPRSMVPV
jgi:serine/threonine-protein kinase